MDEDRIVRRLDVVIGLLLLIVGLLSVEYVPVVVLSLVSPVLLVFVVIGLAWLLARTSLAIRSG